MGNRICDEIGDIIAAVSEDYKKDRPIDKQDVFGMPSRELVSDIIKKLNRIVFAGYYLDKTYKIYNINTMIASVTEDVAYNLNKQIYLALHFDEKLKDKSPAELEAISEDMTVEFMKAIPEIREYLDTDIDALYTGDPAAESKDAIIICYPGLYAIAVYRYAHVLYKLGVPILPRVMTENAHSKTGIDINPGATIGKYFFIDHGTGIVIGETTIIGEHVKLYQGVTLGGISTRGGRSLVDKKRHPTIEDNVTVYSGASILGGDTVIGEGSVIGGNVFLTKSVPPGTKVHVMNQELKFDSDGTPKASAYEDNSWYYVI